MLLKTLRHPCFYQVTGETFTGFGLTGLDYAVIALGVVVVLLLERRQERGIEIRRDLEQKSPLVQWLFLFLPMAALFAHLVFSGSAVDVNLIYQQF